MKKKLLPAAALALAVCFMAAACGSAGSEPSDGHSYFVETDVLHSDLYVGGKNLSTSEYSSLMSEMRTLVNGLEEDFSVEFEESDLSRINAAAAGEIVPVADTTRALMEMAVSFSELTGGKFTPVLFPLTELWGFAPSDAGNYTLPRPEPSSAELETARAVSDLSFFSLSDGGIAKSEAGAKLDFGGIAKGYMCDRVIAHLLEKYSGSQVDVIVKVSSSNTALLGRKHDANGTLRGYTMGIDDPRSLVTGVSYGLYMAELSDVSVTTSADNYRFYIYGGKMYPHIIDPETGKPADRGIISVTVVVPNAAHDSPGALADALSTAAFCMPLTRALSLFSELSETYGIGAVILTKDFKYYTVGDLVVLNRSEYAQYCNDRLGGNYDVDAIEDVYEQGDIGAASDEILPCDREEEYISRVGEQLSRE